MRDFGGERERPERWEEGKGFEGRFIGWDSDFFMNDYLEKEVV